MPTVRLLAGLTKDYLADPSEGGIHEIRVPLIMIVSFCDVFWGLFLVLVKSTRDRRRYSENRHFVGDVSGCYYHS